MRSVIVGLIWDDYTPQVESQITRDIIALQSSGASKVIVVCPTEGELVARLLNALGVEQAALEALAKLWILYRTKEEAILPPEHAEHVVERNLYVKAAEMRLDPTARPGYYLENQGRIGPPLMDPSNSIPPIGGPTDPMVIYLWS